MNIPVTVFIPCYNEEANIVRLLDALTNQSYPGDNIEIIIVDGMSSDSTRTLITKYRKENTVNLFVLDNPHRIIPAALNIGANAASGEILIRMDAHSIPDKDYIELCVKNLYESKGDNVGGKWEIQPSEGSYIAESIAIAAAHPLGSGGANYRSGNQAMEVDTVPFGAFYKKTYIENGPFDESLLANEDYEWNTRLINSGGKIWFDPNIKCIYFSRANLRALIKQYFNYGFWKFRMLLRYPKSLRFRQMIPPLVTIGFILSIGGGLFFSALGYFAVAAGMLFIPVAYVILMLILSHIAAPSHNKNKAPGIAAAIISMHQGWALGLLFSIVKSVFKSLKNRKSTDQIIVN